MEFTVFIFYFKYLFLIAIVVCFVLERSVFILKILFEFTSGTTITV